MTAMDMQGASGLANKVAVVVGAGSLAPGWSNGRACAVTYARSGAAVVCVDRVLSRAEETAAIIAAEGGRAISIEADATSEADISAVMSRATAEFGGIDIVHNNVGVGGTGGTPEDIGVEAWQREIDQNLTSAYLGIRCSAPHLRARHGGVIINTSSLLAVRFLRRPTVGYSAAKAAVEALTRSCAAAYGRDNIRVNCLRIGFSETPLVLSGMVSRGLTEEQKDVEMAKSRAKVPLRGEHSSPFDVAGAALYLATAPHVTGVILNVDGGLDCAPI